MNVCVRCRAHALNRRMKEREKEAEADARDRHKEREEIDELRKKLVAEGHPNPEAEINRRQNPNSAHDMAVSKAASTEDEVVVRRLYMLLSVPFSLSLCLSRCLRASLCSTFAPLLPRLLVFSPDTLFLSSVPSVAGPDRWANGARTPHQRRRPRGIHRQRTAFGHRRYAQPYVSLHVSESHPLHVGHFLVV